MTNSPAISAISPQAPCTARLGPAERAEHRGIGKVAHAVKRELDLLARPPGKPLGAFVVIGVSNSPIIIWAKTKLHKTAVISRLPAFGFIGELAVLPDQQDRAARVRA